MNFSVINEKNNTVDGFALIRKCNKKSTAKGVSFLDILLADKSGEINAKLWDYNEETHGVFEVNTIVKVRGTISAFNGDDQLRIERIRKVVDSDQINIDDYVPTAQYNGEDMFNQLLSIVSNFNDNDLKILTAELLNEYRERLLYFPAAFRLHHAIRGGLLLHTLSIVRLAQGVCKVYPFVDNDLLICGAILHDLGKTIEFKVSEIGVADGYTVDGSLIGHIVRGAMAVRSAGEKLSIPEEKIRLVEHMILSHHGEPEFGAAVRPMFLEAELLSELDLMDARVYEIAQAVSTTEQNDFSSRQWALDDRRLYNHGRTDMSKSTDLDIN
ncbi:MAG: HD domain-containing protein [Oscillospiraceae bacterium]